MLEIKDYEVFRAKSLADGREEPVIADDYDYSRWYAQWSPDGAQLAYRRRKLSTNEKQLVVWSSQTRDEEPLTTLSDADVNVWDWSSDGKWLLTGTSKGIWLVPFSSAPHEGIAPRLIISDNPAYAFYQPQLSPNGRWIVFEAVTMSPNPESALYVVLVSGGSWTRITDGKPWDDKPRWTVMVRQFILFPGAAVSSTSGGSTSIWTRERLSGSRFRCRILKARD